MSNPYYEVAAEHPTLAAQWDSYNWLPDEGRNLLFDKFCKDKGITRNDLAAIGTKMTGGGWLAWLFPAGIKYRALTGERKAEGTLDQFKSIPAYVEPAEGCIVAEGETDGAALHRACPEYSIAIMPAGALAVSKRMLDVLNQLDIPVFLALDADEAGDAGAAKMPGLRMRPPEPFNDWAEALSVGGLAEPLDPTCVSAGPIEAKFVLRAVPAREFADVDEASAEPLLGDADDTVLSAGGTMMLFGKGGSGKTTLELDLAVHLTAGLPWFNIPVPRQCSVLLLENEGPRGKFRVKLRTKFRTWNADNLLVVESPWGEFTFDDEKLRAALVDVIQENDVDVLMAGPVLQLGVKGGGTPSEITEFMKLVDRVRVDLSRPLAVVLVHHDNKAGTVSGAWEGMTDTLAHVYAYGNGTTRIEWEKVRWGSTLHGTTWKLRWSGDLDFELDDTPARTDDDVEADVLHQIMTNPGINTSGLYAAVVGRRERVNEVRERLIEEGRVKVVRRGKQEQLHYLADDDPSF
jgi:hypothetical protein